MTNKYVIHQKEIIENNYLKVVVPLNTNQVSLISYNNINNQIFENLSQRWAYYTNILDLINAFHLCHTHKFFIIISLLSYNLFFLG